MVLYIHIWLCHHLGHVTIDIKHLGRRKGSIWKFLATVTTECMSLKQFGLCSSTFNTTVGLSFLFQKPRVGTILKQQSS